MTKAPSGAVCSIRSTINPKDGTAACLIEWGPIQALLKPQQILDTARDLTAAAASAETDIALIQSLREDIDAEDDVVGVMLTAVRGRRPLPQVRVALRIEAVAGANTGRPYVHIARGSMKAALTPDEARQMAQHWTEAAVAAQIDVRLRYALGEWDHLSPEDIDQLFTLLQKAQR